MADNCGDVLSLEDMRIAKQHNIFEAEVITGRAGGVASGAEIDFATNTVTGQVQKTMPAILRDLGFKPAGFDFTSGGTIAVNERSVAVLWPLADGGDGDYYYWEGALPKVIPANSTPDSTGGVAKGAWRPVGDITLRGDLTTIGEGKAADMIPLVQAGSVQDSVEALTPEMFGAKGDGVTDDTAAIQAALLYAFNNRKTRIRGLGHYLISEPIKIDNYSFGLDFALRGLIVAESWPAPVSWKDATPAILIGSESNGSMVGLNFDIGFFHGKDKATMFRLKSYGCGGSLFHVGRAQNFVIGWQCTESNMIGSSSNRITGDYWLQGTCAVRAARSAPRVVEGTKISIGFITNMKYGAIQLFGGTQYSSVYATDADFSGQYLSELKVNALPAGNIRGQTFASGGKNYEVLDYYQYPRGTYNLLIIEDHLTTNNNSDIAPGATGVVAGTTYTVSSVRTPATNAFYFDIIHGFQGEPFSKVRIECGYLGGIVGGVLFDAEITYGNAYTSFTMSNKSLSIIHDGNFMRISDRYLQGQLFHMYQTRMDTFKHIRIGESRLYGTEVQTSLEQGTTYKVLRTFSFVGDGTVTNTKEVWELTIAAPTDIGGVGGTAQIHVSPTNIQIFANQMTGIDISAQGLALRARQNSVPLMPITFMLQRKL